MSQNEAMEFDEIPAYLSSALNLNEKEVRQAIYRAVPAERRLSGEQNNSFVKYLIAFSKEREKRKLPLSYEILEEWTSNYFEALPECDVIEAPYNPGRKRHRENMLQNS